MAIKHLNVTVTKELNFKFYLILINLNLNSHTWLVATVPDTALDSLQTRQASVASEASPPGEPLQQQAHCGSQANHMLQAKSGNAHSPTVCGCFTATMADLHSCKRDYRACKA